MPIPVRPFLRLIPFATLILALAVPCAAQQEPVVSHVAGNPGGLGLADGVGSAARFTYPSSVWSDGQGLYIAGGGYTIRRMDLATKLVTTIAGTPGVEGLVDGPLLSAKFEDNAAIWGDGTKLYVAAGSFIRLVDLSKGLVTTLAGSRMLNPAADPTDGIGGQAQFRRTRGLWGMGRYLYVLDNGYTAIRGASKPGLIRRLDLQTNAVQTLPPIFLAGSTTTFQVPTAIWGDGERLYVVGNSGGPDVQIGEFDPASNVIRRIVASNFLYVYAIWGDGQGYLYASTSYIHYNGTRSTGVQQINITTGQTKFVLGGGEEKGFAEGVGPNAILRSPAGGTVVNGRMYVADTQTHVIVTADLETFSMTMVAGLPRLYSSDEITSNPRQLYGPTAIWRDRDNLYITDIYSLRRMNLATQTVSTIAGLPGQFGSADGTGVGVHFDHPAGMWGDGTYLYIADSKNRLIRRMALSTLQVTTIAGNRDTFTPRDGIGRDAVFASPGGVWGDGRYLYIADQQAATIRRLTLATNEVATIAGATRATGLQDGIGTEARFNSPTQLTGDGKFLYVTDRSNNAIRRLSLSNYEVTTLKVFDQTLCTFGCLQSLGNMSIQGRWLYVSRGNAVVRVNTDNAAEEVVAGSIQIPGTEDGLASASRFYLPMGLWSDELTMYVADYYNDAIRAIDLVPGVTASSFTVSQHGSISFLSEGPPNLTIGYARIQAQRTDNYGLPGGMAIFGYRQNGVLVSEVSVPAAPLVSSGRLFAEISGQVNTGIAIANPNSQPVTIDFQFTDANGNDFGQGSTVIGPNRQLAGFLNEAPFNGPRNIQATFTFRSSSLVSAIALRGFTNERSEFLMTSLPFGQVSAPGPGTVTVPHFADGGGWKTNIVVVNPTDGPISGELRPYSPDGSPLAMTLNGIRSNVFNYSIPPRSFATFRSEGLQSNIGSGLIAVNSDSTSNRPLVFVTFRYSTNGVTVTESSVAPQSSMVSSMYVESAGEPGTPGSIQSEIAVAHNEETGATIHFELYRADGTFFGRSGDIPIPGRWQTSLLLNQIPGLPPIPASFRGVLRVWSERNRFSPPAVSVTGLRGRYNERGEFLITSTPAIGEVFATTSSELLFPHFAIGGGYTTEFVIFSDIGSSGTVYFFDQNGNPISIGLQ